MEKEGPSSGDYRAEVTQWRLQCPLLSVPTAQCLRPNKLAVRLEVPRDKLDKTKEEHPKEIFFFSCKKTKKKKKWNRKKYHDLYQFTEGVVEGRSVDLILYFSFLRDAA